MRNALIMAVVGCLALTPASVAEDYGTLGATFEITEQDLLEWISERLRQADEAGMLDQLNEDFRERVERSVNRPPAVQGIGTTVETRTWLYDPSITVTEDIADHNGVVFAHEGQQVNPLDMVSLRRRYVFIDGDDEDQVAWALRQHEELEGLISIILVKGSPMDLMRSRQVRFFFDQEGVLTNKFAITSVPASMRQEGRLVRLIEHGPEEWRASDAAR